VFTLRLGERADLGTAPLARIIDFLNARFAEPEPSPAPGRRVASSWLSRRYLTLVSVWRCSSPDFTARYGILPVSSLDW